MPSLRIKLFQIHITIMKRITNNHFFHNLIEEFKMEIGAIVSIVMVSLIALSSIVVVAKGPNLQ